MKVFKITVITLLILFSTVSNLLAGQLVKKPLDEIFDNAAIFPIDYHDKLFVNGEKVDLLEKYKVIKINGNVMFPVKLMNYLVGQLDGINWSQWQSEKPDDIILNNYDTGTTIKFKGNSKVMYINKQPKTLSCRKR